MHNCTLRISIANRPSVVNFCFSGLSHIGQMYNCTVCIAIASFELTFVPQA